MFGIFGDLLRTIFKPSPADRAFKKCFATSRELGTSVMMFHESYKAAGTDLQPDESALDELGNILDGLEESPEPALAIDGVSKFLGCIITEQLGGTWQRANEGYRIVGVGEKKHTVDLATDICRPLTGQPRLTPRAVYERIRQQVS